MKKSLLLIAALAAGFTMQAQQTVFFNQNFDLVAPWASVGEPDEGPAGNVMEDNNQANNAPNLNLKVEIDGTQVACITALNDAGYDFLAWHASNKPEREPAKQIYLQQNYLKFGLTGYQSGIILPAIDGVPAGTTCKLNFDACSQRQGSGLWDNTDLIVIVKNDQDSIVYKAIEFRLNTWDEEAGKEVPTKVDGEVLPFKWYPVSVELEGATITKDTKIIIRNADAQLGSSKALRWYLNNISLTAEATGIDAVIADENAPVEYFNLQGIRVNEPATGLYIRRQGNAVSKVMVK